MMPGHWSTPTARPSIYCLVPQALAGELLGPLRDHFRGEPDVQVIVDRRRAERLAPRGSHAHDEPSAALRGTGDGLGPDSNRRRPVVPRELTASLPPGLAARAPELRWEQRLPPVRRRLQDAGLGALLALIAAGDDDAHTELYWRYASRVRALLASRLADPGELERAMRQTFGRIFDQLDPTHSEGRSFDVFIAATADAVARERAAVSSTPPAAAMARSGPRTRDGART